MIYQYANAFAMSVRNDPKDGQDEVFLTFYQDHPMVQEDGTVKSARETISTILLKKDVVRALSDALSTSLKEQDEQHG